MALQRSEISGWTGAISALRLICRKLPTGKQRMVAPGIGATRSYPMMDILVLALCLGFFAAAIGYTYACERL